MINTELESYLLNGEFVGLLKSLGTDAESVDRQILKNMKLRPGAPPTWAEQFSPLTLLYPSLQCEGLRRTLGEDLPRANLAHLCLLIHSFQEDRLLDGQQKLGSRETIYMKELLLEGLSILRQLSRDDALSEKIRQDYLRAYNIAQIDSYPAAISDRTVIRKSRVAAIATGRAAYGVLATVTLLRVARVHGRQLRTALNAYSCLVTGMQWADDLQDWKEDLSVKDENLLLVELKARGLDPYRDTNDEMHVSNVGYALQEQGIVELAFDQSNRWLQTALRRQRSLNCHQLVNLIGESIEQLPAIKASVVREIKVATECVPS